MRICYITAGAAGTYCGACNRDAALARALTALGHDVAFIPLYTPMLVDGDDPSVSRIFYGGVNAYLQQKSSLFRRTPGFVDWFFDRRRLLEFASRFAVRTRPEDLGEMTVSVLRGPQGFQSKELDKLIGFLSSEKRYDLANLTNTMLSGLAGEIAERLKLPVVCSLQGEESFISRLPEPYAAEARELIKANAKNIALYLAPSDDYADEIAPFLGVNRDRIAVAPPGIDVKLYTGSRGRAKDPFRVGFLSRLAPEKGLDVAVEAFCLMEKHKGGNSLLSVAGTDAGQSAETIRRARETMAAHSLAERLDYCGELNTAGKREFLSKCSVFCQPSRFPERRGIACLEAMASGVPIIVHNSGIMPRLIEQTGGGVLLDTLEPEVWAQTLVNLRDNPSDADIFGIKAAAGVARFYSAENMAKKTLEAYNKVVSGS
ncbi:MAG TPA: glycosyltransferase family 4 protein [Candidatus Brocadiia bacterium]|nr:glycosyltransferase family 4 protein [Candidatus Brocadiia bacterium]